MKTKLYFAVFSILFWRKQSFLLGILATWFVILRCPAAGTWIPLAHSPPGAAGHFLLLSDGTVMAED